MILKILLNLMPTTLNLFFTLLWIIENSMGGWFGGGLTAFLQLIFNTFLIPVYLVLINFFLKKQWGNNIIILLILIISYFLCILVGFLNSYFSVGFDSIGWSIEKLQLLIGLSILIIGWIFICLFKGF